MSSKSREVSNPKVDTPQYLESLLRWKASFRAWPGIGVFIDRASLATNLRSVTPAAVAKVSGLIEELLKVGVAKFLPKGGQASAQHLGWSALRPFRQDFLQHRSTVFFMGATVALAQMILQFAWRVRLQTQAAHQLRC